ncbi:MAG: pyridoxal-phosphate dependent enzyme [Rhodococcus sp. (in: high G+C Gram-positive bacteria)]|nr:pyridoxal-phosphate dependent enzyme [Rhodococcus sp. (in: high G+C Gram-positive bacteria)]
MAQAPDLAATTGLQPPTWADIQRASQVVRRHLPVAPLISHPTLGAGSCSQLFVKHENVQPTGAFKVRGGLNLVAGLDEPTRARGIIGYSTGNHAQSLAYAAADAGVRCVIVMPAGANPVKAHAVRMLGAELIEHGANFDEARAHAEFISERDGLRLVSAANEPAILAGVATAYVELVEQQPDLDAVVVPVGGGSGAAAACLVASALAPHLEVFAVQSEAARAAHDSWTSGTCVERPNATRVEGLATGAGFALTQRVMRERLGGFLLVTDDDITLAQRALLYDAHTLSEGAGAAALAAVYAHPNTFAGKRVAVVCTGANASESEIRRVVS